MNIAFVCDSIFKVPSGAFISTIRFAEELKKLGHKIIFLTSRYPGEEDRYEHHGIKVYTFKSIKIPNSSPPFYMSFPKVEAIEKILVSEKIEILHIIDPNPAAIHSIKAAKRKAVKVVAHCHTQPENLMLWVPSFFNKMIRSFFYLYLKWIYSRADKIISPSLFGKRVLQKNMPYKIEVLSNGIDLEKFHNVPYSSFLKKYHIPKKSTRVLYVGRIQQEKDLTTLIKSIPKINSEIKDIHFLIVGGGPLLESNKKLSKSLGIKNITFTGRVSDEEIVRAFSSSSLFVLPSISELEGMAVLEAMACGNPILIANSSESASVFFVKKNGLLFTPHDPSDLADKALKILKDKALQKKMRLNSLNLVKKYQLKESVRRLEKMYSSLI